MILQKTKLLLPAPVSGAIQRPRLIEMLKQRYVLHAIVAPAGYGKTTLAAQWAQQRGQGVAWLSLDAEDNNPSRFIRYVVAALQSVIEAIDIAQEIDLDTVPSTVLINLSNLLIAHPEQPVCLILDNYQVIDTSAIHSILDFFLSNPVPDFHIVLLSRTDLPLSIARLRMSQQVCEVRVPQLMLNQAEIVTYFEKAAIHLTPEQISVIYDKTQGWLVGLQFLKLRLDRAEHVENTIQDFSGRDVFVGDYFESEFFSRCDADTQLFLMQSSILDTLYGDLCNAIVQQEDSYKRLVTLEKQGFPLFTMDTEQATYCYHPLFRDFLSVRLAKNHAALMPILHRRASEWFTAHDNRSVEAITHLLHHASQVSQKFLLDYLEQYATTLLKQGYDALILEYLRDIRFEALYEYPALVICYLWALYGNGKALLAQRLLHQAETILPDSMRGDIRALQAQFSVNPHKSRELMTEALAQLSDDDVITRALLHHNLGRIRFFDEGQTDTAISLLTQSVQVYEQIGHHALWAVAMDLLIAVRQRHGSLLEAEALCRYGIARCDYLDRMDFVGSFCSQLGKILYERNHLTEAVGVLRRGRNFSRMYNRIHSFVASSLTLARIVTGEDRTAILADLRDFVKTDVYQLTRIAAYPVSRLAEHGWFAPRIDWQKRDFDKQSDTPNIQSVYTYLNVAQYLVAGINPQPRKALTLLLQLESLTTRLHHKSSLIEVLILQSAAYEMTGNRDAALLALGRALLLAQQTGHYRVFMDNGDIVSSLLDILAYKHGNSYVLRFIRGNTEGSAHQFAAPLSQPLTPREVEILHLLSQGYSNPEISTRCSISVTTTRWHVRNIYRKLGVDNRTRATVRARNLGLI